MRHTGCPCNDVRDQSMHIAELLLINLALLVGLQVAAWLLSLWLRNAGIADVFWGLGFVLVAWTSYWLAGSASPRGLLLAVLITLWGLRLAGYLAWRNVGKSEDYRYHAMRKRRPQWFWVWSLVFVFQLQGLLIYVVSLPVQLASPTVTPLYWLDVLGTLLWFCGWAFESIGDWQLVRFKADEANRGRVLQSGLWRYTRHPNYFGDFLVWWGLFLVAAASGGLWWTIFCPVVMTILLVRVSGVALLEKTITQRRPEYRQYAERTSAFVPWPPRR